MKTFLLRLSVKGIGSNPQIILPLLIAKVLVLLTQDPVLNPGPFTLETGFLIRSHRQYPGHQITIGKQNVPVIQGRLSRFCQTGHDRRIDLNALLGNFSCPFFQPRPVCASPRPCISSAIIPILPVNSAHCERTSIRRGGLSGVRAKTPPSEPEAEPGTHQQSYCNRSHEIKTVRPGPCQVGRFVERSDY